MPWTPILNWTSPEAQAETFCQIYQRQHKTAFKKKKPPHIFATEVRPESSPRGFTAQLQVFLISSVAIPMSQGRACNAEEKETLRSHRKRHTSHRSIKMRQVSPYSEQSAVWRVIVKLLQSSQIIKKTSICKSAHTELCNITNPCHVFCNNC